MDQILEFEQFIDELADAAAQQTLAHFRQDVTVINKLKEGFDPVTFADRAAENSIRQRIEDRFPDHGIHGEEFGKKSAKSEYIWVIDPIDGTRAFISGLPVWGTLIGLLHNDRAILGLMDQPFTGERWVGGPSGTKFTHHQQSKQVTTSVHSKLADATLCTTDPYLFNPSEMRGFGQLRAQTNLQRYGLDCYAYAALAHGQVDLVVETDLQPYDIVGLIPVVQAAGGMISTWAGEPAENGGQILASANAQLHQQALEILQEFTK